MANREFPIPEIGSLDERSARQYPLPGGASMSEALLSAPTGLTPASGTNINKKTSRLSWNASVGAATYEVSIDNGNPVTGITNTYYDWDASAASAGEHLWKVRARDGSGAASPYTDDVILNIIEVALVSPADDVAVPAGTIELAYSVTGTASAIEVKICTDVRFRDVTDEISGSPFTSESSPFSANLSTPDEYWWSVRIQDGNEDWSAYPTARKLTTTGGLPIFLLMD